jgi:hypothetical protein
MSARKSAETNPQPKAVDVPDEVTPDVPKPPVKVPSIMGSTFAERASTNKSVANGRAEAKG